MEVLDSLKAINLAINSSLMKIFLKEFIHRCILFNKKKEANLSSVQQPNVRCASLERMGDICVNCHASPAADDFLISLQAFPNRLCLCFPGSPSYSRAAAECLRPWLWPPFGLEQTWNWTPVLREHRRTSWPATQQVDSPACLPTKRWNTNVRLILSYWVGIGGEKNPDMCSILILTFN